MYKKKISIFIILILFIASSAMATNMNAFLNAPYNAKRNFVKNLRKAKKKAKRESKNIFIIAGDERCGWCNFLNEHIVRNKKLINVIDNNYIPLKVHYTDKEFIKLFGKVPATPHFYILDSKGKLLISQGTSVFEKNKKSYNKRKFLKKLKELQDVKTTPKKAKKIDADYSFSYNKNANASADFEKAKIMAKKRGANILLIAGRDSCSWCTALDDFIYSNKEIEKYIKNNFVVLKVHYSGFKTNVSFFKKNGVKKIQGVPHFFTFNHKGKLLKDQPTGVLEDLSVAYEIPQLEYFFEQWIFGKKIPIDDFKAEKPIYSNVYDKNRKPFEDLEKAKKIATKKNKNILVLFGGKWCTWTKRFDNFFWQEKDINEFLHNNFVVLKVFYDGKIGKNFLKKYGDTRLATPHIYVLNEKGERIKSISSGLFEDGMTYNKKKIRRFLKKSAIIKK